MGLKDLVGSMMLLSFNQMQINNLSSYHPRIMHQAVEFRNILQDMLSNITPHLLLGQAIITTKEKSIMKKVAIPITIVIAVGIIEEVHRRILT